jgi:hypothetical protein
MWLETVANIQISDFKVVLEPSKFLTWLPRLAR